MVAGNIGNQEQSDSNYSFHSRLRYDGNHFVVEASAPSDLRKYVCDYEGDYAHTIYLILKCASSACSVSV